MNLSKLKTEQLQKKIADGKIPADQMEAAQALLSKRMTKPGGESNKPAAKKVVKAAPEETTEATPKKKKAEKKETPAKKKAEAAAPKEEKEKKEKAAPAEKAPKTVADYDFDTKTISGLVKSMLMPKDEKSTVAGCTYGEANKAVQAKFKRKLHTSEFQRNFDILAGLGVLTEKLPPRYKPATEEKAAEEAATPAKKKGGKKKEDKGE